MTRSEIQQLEQKIAELTAKVQKLEAMVETLAKSPAAIALPEPAQEPPKQEIPADVILAISAAVAAFLGKRASIRQIRLSGTTPWAQQGRATVQASHAVEYVRGLR